MGHLAATVESLRGALHGQQFVDQLGIGSSAARNQAIGLFPGPVGARGDLTALLTQDSTRRSQQPQ